MERTERGRVSRALVLAGTVYTSYQRFGEGPALVVLPGDYPADPGRDSALADLGGAFTVILPEGRPWMEAEGGSPFGDWLRGFLEGLGVERASILAERADGLSALAYAQLEPDRVDRIVLVACQHVKGSVETTLLSDRLERARVRLLTVSCGEDAPAIAVGAQALLAHVRGSPGGPEPRQHH